METKLRKILLVFVVCHTVPVAAATKTWSGASNGNWNVAAMVLYTGSASDPTYAQDQLVMISSPTSNGSPVPDGGATIALFGMAFSGVSFLRRKMV